MKGSITLLVGVISAILFCTDLQAQQPCRPFGGFILRGGSAVQPNVVYGPPNTRSWSPPAVSIRVPPRASQPARGSATPLPPPSARSTADIPPVLPGPVIDDAPPKPCLPPREPKMTPMAALRECDPAVKEVLDELLTLGQQNGTKIDQLLSYTEIAPTADQLKQEHQRIEQLIAGAVTKLEQQHLRIEQEIKSLVVPTSAATVSPADLATVSAQVSNLGEQLTVILQSLAEMKTGGGASAVAVIGDESDASLQRHLAGITQRLDVLTKQVNILVDRGPGEVNLTVDTPTFLSPDYIDLSLIWAQQKATGIHHAVLVVDTEAASWNQLGQAYAEAKSGFAPISLFDVRSQNVVVRKLPQLVLYPKEGEARVLSDPQEIVTALTKFSRTLQ